MKKNICLFLITVLLFSFLGGCQKAEPEPEETPSEITVIVTPKPEPEIAVTEEEVPEPVMTELEQLLPRAEDLSLNLSYEEFFSVERPFEDKHKHGLSVKEIDGKKVAILFN